MATEITMPKLSDTMQEGTILKWRVQKGETIAQGDVIADVETDKAAMEMEAFEAGTVVDLRVPEGETVAVGTVIAVLNGGGETAAESAAKIEPVESKPEEAELEPRKTDQKATKRTEKDAGEEKKAEAEAEEEPVATAEREAERGQGEPGAPTVKEVKLSERESGLRQQEIAASPAARQLARARGIDLSRIRGTGPGGRIVMADIEKGRVPESAAKAPSSKAAPQREKAPAGEQAAKEKPQRSVKIRRIVARKMVESWQSAPHFFVTVAVDMTDLIRIRKSLGASINDFIVAAAARCLRDFPWVNSFWVEGEAVEQKEINISIAVATDRGLYNPVLRNCANLSLKEIGKRSADLISRAHNGRLAAEELEGGTFTISNMGMLGVESFSAIITPPQAAVLAVGTVRGEVVVDEKGEPGIATLVRLTLSADHRILDGADAAEFLTGMKSYLEAPVTLVTGEYGKE